MHLRVRVHDDLVLDAGVCEEVSGEVVIHPPELTLFHQVLEYLRAKPDAPASGFTNEDEGAAAAAVTLRWGSYLAVLADRTKPVWAEARSQGVSRISNSEMARINIEASAGLALWLDILRAEPVLYETLARRALAYLPMPRWQARPEASEFAILAMPEVREKAGRGLSEARLAQVRSDAERYPSRLFANALVNTAWRNGPVEDIHAGDFRGYPLDRRRVTVAEERALMGFAIDRLATGMDVCRALTSETPPSTWSEQVVPYGIAQRITPPAWTLTEATREARLPRAPTSRA